MYDVITFGSATVDVFLKLNRSNFRIARGKDFFDGAAKGICFPLGSKLLVDNSEIFSGGGGTNTACSFSNLGMRTSYVGVVGNDIMAALVLDDLKRFKVSTVFVRKDIEKRTALSVVLSGTRERTILIHKGASHFLTKQDIPWLKIKKAKWFYLAPLYGKSADLLDNIVRFAREHKIAVAFNPSRQHLKLGKEKIKPVLALVDILILNESEAEMLTDVLRENDLEMLSELRYMCPGIIVVTKGHRGALVCDGRMVFHAETASKIKAKEKTGAGDAFASGFVAGLFKKNDIEYAIQMGFANAESCIQEIGAKNGLLKKSKKINMQNYNIARGNL